MNILYRKYFLSEIKDEQGYTLLTVLVFMIIIMLILLCLIEYVHVQYRFILKDSHQVQADYLAESGVAYFLNDIDKYFEQIQFNPTQSFDCFYPIEQDTVYIQAMPWGGFIRVEVNAKYKSAFSRKQAMIGQGLTESMDNAIVLDNLDNPLIVTGETEITGNVAVGTRGVKSGNIKGIRFKGKRLVTGDIITKNRSQMSAINPQVSFEATKTMLDGLQSQPDKDPFNAGSVIDEERLPSCLIFEDDFEFTDWSLLDSTKACTVVTTGSLLVGPDLDLPRQSMLVAADTLILKNCNLDQALIYGKKQIQVSGNVCGNAQFLSDEQIIVKNGVTLCWPSILYVNREVPNAQPFEAIKLEGGTSVRGAVVLYTSEKTNKNVMNLCRIKVEKFATMHGLLYTNLSADMGGELTGHASVSSFYLYYSPTHYINYLLDARIDRNGLDPEFPIPVRIGEEPTYRIINWQNL